MGSDCDDWGGHGGDHGGHGGDHGGDHGGSPDGSRDGSSDRSHSGSSSRTSDRSRSRSSSQASDRSDRSQSKETGNRSSRSSNTSPARYRNLWAMGIDPREWSGEQVGTSGISPSEREQLSKMQAVKDWIESSIGSIYENTHPEDMPEELAIAKSLGVKPMHVDDPGFSKVANEEDNSLKWVVTESGDLLFVPHAVGGIEISHSVLTDGRPVVAAGEAVIVVDGNERLCIEISKHSGHYLSDDNSLYIGKQAFKEFGITFLGEHTSNQLEDVDHVQGQEDQEWHEGKGWEGTGGGEGGSGGGDGEGSLGEYEESSSSSDWKSGKSDIYGNIGINKFEDAEEFIKELLRMRESSKGERDEEQETAEISGVRPQSVDNPDFEPMAQVGPIKWVVLESSQLLTDPSLVANTVLTASEAVIAAGDYIDVVEGNERFCIEVTTNSDLNQADDQSDGGRGDRNSGGHGDGNGGGGGDGTEGGDEASSSSSDNQSNDGYGEIGVNIYEKWSVKDMWQMLASRKRAGDEGISQGSGVQVEDVRGESSRAQFGESDNGGGHDGGRDDENSGGQGDGNGDGEGSEGGDEGEKRKAIERVREEVMKLVQRLKSGKQVEDEDQEVLDEMGQHNSGDRYDEKDSIDPKILDEVKREALEEFGERIIQMLNEEVQANPEQPRAPDPTKLSDVVSEKYSELATEISHIEGMLRTKNLTDTFPIIERVSQEDRIDGFADWVAKSATIEAERILDRVMELTMAWHVFQEYMDDPSVTISIGQDVRTDKERVSSFDIVVQREEPGEKPEILRQIEVNMPDGSKNPTNGQAFINAIIHAATKIRGIIEHKKRTRGSESPPPGMLEATTAVSWPPKSFRTKDGDIMVFDTHGKYMKLSVADTNPRVKILAKGNLLDKTVDNLNRQDEHYKKQPVERVKRLTVLDRNGRVLFELTNKEPGVRPAEWTWRDLQGQ